MGWEENRRTNKFDAFMENNNYPEFIREFVREFGGLQVKDLDKEGHLKDRYRTNLDLFESDGMGADSVAEDWSLDLGRKLYVVGLYSPENFDIAIDENGAVYFLGQELWCVGKNLYEGIESIIRFDNSATIQLNPKDNYKSNIWNSRIGEVVDFEAYEFKYDKFKKFTT